MTIDKLYLLFTVIVDDKNNDSSWVWDVSEKHSGWLTHTLFNGLPIRSHSCPVLTHSIKNQFWRQNVENIIIYDYGKTYSKSCLTLCYTLKPIVLDTVFVEQGDLVSEYKERRNLLRTLIIETFPDIFDIERNIKRNKRSIPDYCVGEELANYKLLEIFKNPVPDYFYISQELEFLDSYLIVVPSPEELNNFKKSETVADFLLRFEKFIKRDITRRIDAPYYYVDYIETAPSFYRFVQESELRVFISTNQTKEVKGVSIPDSIRQLHNFDKKLAEFNEIKLQIAKLYSNKFDIESYVSSISKKNIFKNYSIKFKNERLQYIQVKFEVEKIVRDSKTSVKETVPYSLNKYYERFELRDINPDRGSIMFSMLRKKNDEFDNFILEIEQLIQDVIHKDIYINEYIRDIISVESMWSNLKLQKALKLLTYLAILLGALAVFATIYSTEIKRYLNGLFTSE